MTETERVAKILKTDVKVARAYCERVQSLFRRGKPTYSQIAECVLRHDGLILTEQQVASEIANEFSTFRLHTSRSKAELRISKRRSMESTREQTFRQSIWSDVAALLREPYTGNIETARGFLLHIKVEIPDSTKLSDSLLLKAMKEVAQTHGLKRRALEAKIKEIVSTNQKPKMSARSVEAIGYTSLERTELNNSPLAIYSSRSTYPTSDQENVICPHGRSKKELCGICDLASYRFYYGWWEDD